MVNIYNNIKNENGIDDPKRVRLFITKVGENGELNEFTSGNSVVPMTNGTMFIVDDWLIDQLDKVVFKDGTLQVKEGEQLDEPVKSEKQLMIEEMERQIALLKAEDTEEQSEKSIQLRSQQFQFIQQAMTIVFDTIELINVWRLFR